MEKSKEFIGFLCRWSSYLLKLPTNKLHMTPKLQPRSSGKLLRTVPHVRSPYMPELQCCSDMSVEDGSAGLSYCNAVRQMKHREQSLPTLLTKFLSAFLMVI